MDYGLLLIINFMLKLLNNLPTTILLLIFFITIIYDLFTFFIINFEAIFHPERWEYDVDETIKVIGIIP